MSDFDVDAVLNEVVTETRIEAQKDSRQPVQDCTAILKKLGYDVTVEQEEGIDLHVSKGEKSYGMAVVDGEGDTDYIGIPVGNIDSGFNIFNTKAEMVAFRQSKHIYQFVAADLKDLIKDLVDKLKNERKYAFASKQNAINMKRLYVKSNGDSYDIILYLPIETVCKKIKHRKIELGV